MSWTEYHAQAEHYANLAEEAILSRNVDRATEFYCLAAAQETLALSDIDPEKTRTIGITAVSAAALWFKGRNLSQAQNAALRGLVIPNLPPFAQNELKELLQTVWSEEIRAKSGIEFTSGEVLVSVKGGEVVVGGAPLELILRKVDEVSRIFYRTIEMMLDRPFRRRGMPGPDILEQFRPWLFQAPPGSYQFAVRVERPKQLALFPEPAPQVEQITHKFLEIVRATTDDPQGALVEVVPDKEYRDTFLKLARGLAPTGKVFGQMEISSPSTIGSRPVVLIPASRETMNRAIRKARDEGRSENLTEEIIKLHGVLRGLQLDKDWLEINQGEEKPKLIKIYEAGEAVDDVIGPMVNHKVIVDAVLKPTKKYAYRDIQLEE